MQISQSQPVSPGRRRWYSCTLLGAAAGMVLLGVAFGCKPTSTDSPDETSEAKAPDAPEVKVATPEKNNVRRTIERPSYNSEAYERTLVYAKIPGYVQKWNFDMGKHVHKGDILAELYIPELDAELQQKQTSILQATAEIEQAKTVIPRAQAEFDRAKSQYERLAKAGNNGLLDKEQVEESRLGVAAAQAAVAKARADVSVAETRLGVAKANWVEVNTRLQYTKIPAPFDGVITRKMVNTRDFVRPPTAGKGEPLFMVEQIDPVRVFVNVQELEAVWVRKDDSTIIRAQSLPGQLFKGKVSRTAEVLDPQNRTLRTEIELPNPEGKFLPGTYVNATIIVEHKKVWTLPAVAVLTKGDQSFCFRVKDRKVVRTPIQVGLRGNEAGKELVEILAMQTEPTRPAEEPRWDKITGDEQIVAGDPSSLTDGQAVRVVTEKK